MRGQELFSIRMDFFIGQTNAAPQQPVIVVDDGKFDWTDVARGIQGGSWAVILAAGVIYVLTHKSVKEYFTRQQELNDKLKDNVVQNTETLKQMSQNDAKVADTLQRHQITIESMIRDTPQIKAKQERQIQLLQKIADRLQLPLPVQVEETPDDEKSPGG